MCSSDLGINIQEGNIAKFITYLVLKFQVIRGNEYHNINIDYSLYKMIKQLAKGYLPTYEERHKHIVLEAFIAQLLKEQRSLQQICQEEVLIFEKIDEAEEKLYRLEKNAFGKYEFCKVDYYEV